jgi:hypothetical protein
VLCCVRCVAGEFNDDSGGEVASWNQGLVLQAWYVLYVLYHHDYLYACVRVRESKSERSCRYLRVAMYILISSLLFLPYSRCLSLSLSCHLI